MELEHGVAPGSPEYRRLMVALVCAGLATFAQLYAPQAILPLVSADLQVTAAQSALLVSAATIGLAAGSLPWAWLADRIGRLPVMRASMIAATVLGVGSALAPGFDLILVLRVLEGVALGGVPALAIAYLHEEVRYSVAAAAAAVYVSGTAVGGLAGRLVSAPFGEWLGWRAGISAVLVLAAVATVVFVVIAPAPRTTPVRMVRMRRPRASVRELVGSGMLTLYAQGFLLMGGFVALYNYLAFRLQAAPFGLSTAVTSLLFLAYLGGTAASQQAGRWAGRLGRLRVLLVSIGVFVVGILLTLAPSLSVIIVGLVVLTAGFFGAHAIAAGWTAARTFAGGSKAPALYNVAYYAGSSVMGWFGGIVFASLGWSGLAGLTVVLAFLAAGLALTTLRGPETVSAG